ncbi:MAG: exosortase [Nitrospirae bacterium]|nr:exosortase [Nitrospirota bacterium]
MQTTANLNIRDIYSLKSVTYLLLTILYIPTFYKLSTGGWKLADYTQGPLILIAFLWLIWTKRAAFSLPSTNRIQPFSFCLLTIGLLLYAFGAVQKLLILEIFSLILVLIGTTGFLLGKDATKKILFPALFLIFLVPPPLFVIDMMTSPLKRMVAKATEIILSSAGYLISRNGVILFVGDYNIVVGDACSGLRSLISLMSVGAIYVYLTNSSALKRGLLFSSIIPIAIFANIIRLLLLALITYHFGEAAGQGFFHNFSGILVFVMSLIGLFLLDLLINRKLPLPFKGKGTGLP